jgi:hypothetical protein
MASLSIFKEGSFILLWLTSNPPATLGERRADADWRFNHDELSSTAYIALGSSKLRFIPPATSKKSCGNLP